MGLQTTRLEDDPLRGSFVLFISKNRVVTTPPRQTDGGDIQKWPQYSPPYRGRNMEEIYWSGHSSHDLIELEEVTQDCSQYSQHHLWGKTRNNSGVATKVPGLALEVQVTPGTDREVVAVGHALTQRLLGRQDPFNGEPLPVAASSPGLLTGGLHVGQEGLVTGQLGLAVRLTLHSVGTFIYVGSPRDNWTPWDSWKPRDNWTRWGNWTPWDNWTPWYTKLDSIRQLDIWDNWPAQDNGTLYDNWTPRDKWSAQDNWTPRDNGTAQDNWTP